MHLRAVRRRCDTTRERDDILGEEAQEVLYTDKIIASHDHNRFSLARAALLQVLFVSAELTGNLCSV